ncbi:hypothetical protein C4546_04765 [Candidatus Parcubacteria bacterium]|jgi:hypothetical protein|nr:MAG: hypothetical protein C4546_04765 [Candidatus Parcubacteria bacterium]
MIEKNLTAQEKFQRIQLLRHLVKPAIALLQKEQRFSDGTTRLGCFVGYIGGGKSHTIFFTEKGIEVWYNDKHPAGFDFNTAEVFTEKHAENIDIDDRLREYVNNIFGQLEGAVGLASDQLSKVTKAREESFKELLRHYAWLTSKPADSQLWS